MDLYAGIAWLLLILPISAFAVQFFVGRRLPRQGDFVSITAICTALILGLFLFGRVIFGEQNPAFLYHTAYPWFSGGSIDFSFGFHIDNLTAVMVMVVTVVSSLVHIYSTGYMKGERYYDRFFGYLSLFSFSMLALVLCDNLLILFICWELVGVSSYFLIGFFFWKDSAADACKKAFITNRVGDFFFLIGILIVLQKTGTLNYTEIFHAIEQGHLTGAML
ncbi:MAG: proton-conducting transporter membrane subunit, partial [bacterium]|nr:proton-conducting transporter membrane subunit [bacterium]